MKKTILLCLTLCISLLIHAQATDLVIDCQTPGWLSSMINYGDQQTVRNLKVTGYINSTDLAFVGTLVSRHNLNGVIDFGEVTIVGTGDVPDDYFNGGSLGIRTNGDKTLTLVKFICPKGATSAINVGAGFETIDTLVYDCSVAEFDQGYVRCNRRIGHLVLGESITRIKPRVLTSGIVILFPTP